MWISSWSNQTSLKEGENGYLAHALSKNDDELVNLLKKVKDLGCFVKFMEVSIKENKDLIRALSDKHSKLEEKVQHSTLTIKKSHVGYLQCTNFNCSQV